VHHIGRTQALADSALGIRDSVRSVAGLHHSPDVRVGIARTVQLATLAVLAADHLLFAVGVLRDAYGGDTPATADTAAAGRRLEALLEAGRRIALAEQLTSLGAEDCLAAAGTLARALHQQGLGPEQEPPSLSATQHTALRAIAAGRVTLHRLVDRLHVSRGDLRLTITTVRSLESHGLVTPEPRPLAPHSDRLHLTRAGQQALAAALALPAHARPTTRRPPARPATAATATTKR
jgi:DNA-binding MarR family transcriptional regulator